MVLFNYSTRELTAKIVYYGPGICGKTTNLQFIHENLPGEVRGKMLSLATKTDRTLFFDFLPIDLGEIRGMKTRVQLYTVPGQVFYNETRKLVLKGVDGIVFVADSQETMLGANTESFKNLEDNLKAHGLKLAEMPHVIQFNKRDLPKLASIEALNAALNKHNAPFYESVATTGIGVQDTLKAIVKLVLLNLTRKYETKQGAEGAVAAAPAMTAAAATSSSTAVGSSTRSASPAAVLTDAPPFAKSASVTNAPAASSATPAAARGAGKPGAKDLPHVAPSPTSSLPAFDAHEINGLVDEVEEVGDPSPAPPHEAGTWMGGPEPVDLPVAADIAPQRAMHAPVEDLRAKSPAPPGGFEVDRGFDPAWGSTAGAPASIAVSSDEGAAEPMAAAADPDMLLTEIASNDDLFSDPSLEIAHLKDGQGREIVVPVVLGEGPNAKRYKLAIRLRLQAVD